MLEREFYRLDYLAERWGCEVEDLLHLGAAGKAEICADISDAPAIRSLVKARLFMHPECSKDGNDKAFRDVSRLAQYDSCGNNAELPWGILRVLQLDIRQAISGRRDVRVEAGMNFINGEWQMVLIKPRTISWGNLCVTLDEFRRLDVKIRDFTTPKRVEVEMAVQKASPTLLSAPEELAPKSRNTAARIIAGLVLAYHGTSAHAGRIDRIGEVIDELSRVGVTVSEDTLRKWLQDGAALIEAPVKT